MEAMMFLEFLYSGSVLSIYSIRYNINLTFLSYFSLHLLLSYEEYEKGVYGSYITRISNTAVQFFPPFLSLPGAA